MVGEFFLQSWLNRTDVRHALHVPDEIQAWEDCTSLSYWDYTEQQKGSIYAWK